MESGLAKCPQCGAVNRLKSAAPEELPVCGKCGTSLPWIVAASDGSFDREIQAPVPVLVDFWAEWCGPCRIVTPIIEELARGRAGKIKVVKLNVDQNPTTASRFAVQSIPLLLLFKSGIVAETMVGALPKAEILRRVAPHLP
jgi:thioredoxin 2